MQPPPVTGISVPTLTEVLAIVPPDATVYVEIKGLGIELLVADVIGRSSAHCGCTPSTTRRWSASRKSPPTSRADCCSSATPRSSTSRSSDRRARSLAPLLARRRRSRRPSPRARRANDRVDRQRRRRGAPPRRARSRRHMHGRCQAPRRPRALYGPAGGGGLGSVGFEHNSPASRRFSDERFESRDLGFRRGDVVHVRGEVVGGQLTAGFARVVDGVAESLREAIDGLARAVQLEAQTSFVDRALCRASGAIQLLAQPVEQCHLPLPSRALTGPPVHRSTRQPVMRPTRRP